MSVEEEVAVRVMSFEKEVAVRVEENARLGVLVVLELVAELMATATASGARDELAPEKESMAKFAMEESMAGIMVGIAGDADSLGTAKEAKDEVVTVVTEMAAAAGS